MNTDYTVFDVMNTDIVLVEPDLPIVDCAKVMAGRKVGSAIVYDKKGDLGIITDQDMARRVVATGASLLHTTARDIMSSPIISIGPGSDVYDALVLMNQKKVRHIAVVQDSVAVGMLSLRDIVRIAPSLIELTEFTEALREREPIEGEAL